jgi:hypothetical protein
VLQDVCLQRSSKVQYGEPKELPALGISTAAASQHKLQHVLAGSCKGLLRGETEAASLLQLCIYSVLQVLQLLPPT